jgi:hypothetical protein
VLPMHQFPPPQYHRDGFLVIDNAIDLGQVDALKDECDRLMSSYDIKQHHVSVFTTVNQVGYA